MRNLLIALLLASTAAHANEYEDYEKATQWKKVESDNGQIFYVDLAPSHINTDGGIVTVRVWTYQGRMGISAVTDVSAVGFDCAGHFDEASNGVPWTYIPPKSIIRVIQDMACKAALTR